MEQSTKEAWRRLLDEARRELPDATVRTWLEPAVPIALDDDRLIVGAPDQVAGEWNDRKPPDVPGGAPDPPFAPPPPVASRGQGDAHRRPKVHFLGPRVATATTWTSSSSTTCISSKARR